MIYISLHSLSLLLTILVVEICAQNGDEATPVPEPMSNGKVSRPCRHTTTSGQMTFPTLPPIRTPPFKPLTPPKPVSGNSGDRDPGPLYSGTGHNGGGPGDRDPGPLNSGSGPNGGGGPRDRDPGPLNSGTGHSGVGPGDRDPGPLNSDTGHNGGGPITTDAPGPVPRDGHAPLNSEEDNHSPIETNDVIEGRKKRQLPAPPPGQVPLTTGTPGTNPNLLTLLCTPTTAVPPIPGVPGVTNGATVPGGASLPNTPPISIPGEPPKGLTGEIPVTTPNPLVPSVTPQVGLTTPLNVPGIPPQPPIVG